MVGEPTPSRARSVLEVDADRLAATFTARELAGQLADRNRGFVRWRERAFRAEGKLREIAAGMYTEAGAREEARRTVESRSRVGRSGGVA